jgi:hypothetical protein
MRLLVVAVALACAGCAGVKLPTYVCYRAVDQIVIDGKLTEQSWLRAASTGNLGLAATGQQAPVHTSVKMAWDDRALYLAFECEDRDIYATFRERDEAIWLQDAVEVFIMERSVGQGHYVEYEVSPLGAMFDWYAVKPYVGIWEWSSAGWQVAATMIGTPNDPTDGDVGYTVEMAIPFVDLSLDKVLRQEWAGWDGQWTEQEFAQFCEDKYRECIPLDGAEVRVNLYRLDYTTPAQLGAPGENRVAIAWSPVPDGAFHAPERFGIVRFSTRPVGSRARPSR